MMRDPISVWDEVHAVSLKGVYLGCQAAIPEVVRREGGSLIFTASVLGIVGDGDLAAYGTAKGGLRAARRSAAVAYWSRADSNRFLPFVIGAIS